MKESIFFNFHFLDPDIWPVFNNLLKNDIKN